MYFSAFFTLEILWFLVYLTILALIAVSLLLFTLICAAIVRLNSGNKNLFSASNGTHEIGIKRCGIFLHIFWYMWKVCRIMSTYSNAHAKIKNWIFDVQFPGNWFGFSIISHNFWSPTICAIRIQFPFAQFKNSKSPGIQPSHSVSSTLSNGRLIPSYGPLIPSMISLLKRWYLGAMSSQ